MPRRGALSRVLRYRDDAAARGDFSVVSERVAEPSQARAGSGAPHLPLYQWSLLRELALERLTTALRTRVHGAQVRRRGREHAGTLGIGA